MHRALQGKITAAQIIQDLDDKLNLADAESLLNSIREGKLNQRNRAISVIAILKVYLLSRFEIFF